MTRVFGQGNVEVLCNDNVIRLCVIRKKFRGRNKRDNNVKVGSIILVGIREWEVIAEGKRPKCDLLYTYSDNQMDQLKHAKGMDEAIFPELKQENMDGWEFSNDVDEEENVVITHKKPENKKKDTNIDFNFDDI